MTNILRAVMLCSSADPRGSGSWPGASVTLSLFSKFPLSAGTAPKATLREVEDAVGKQVLVQM